MSRDLIGKAFKKPKFVFKLLTPSNSSEDIAFSAIENYKYIKDKVNPNVPLNPLYDEKYGIYSIYEGYHSYIEFPKYCGFHDIYLMEIPPGTECCESLENEEIVSSNIIMRRRLTFNGKLKLIYRIMLKLGINPQRLWKYF